MKVTHFLLLSNLTEQIKLSLFPQVIPKLISTLCLKNCSTQEDVEVIERLKYFYFHELDITMNSKSNKNSLFLARDFHLNYFKLCAQRGRRLGRNSSQRHNCLQKKEIPLKCCNFLSLRKNLYEKVLVRCDVNEPWRGLHSRLCV